MIINGRRLIGNARIVRVAVTVFLFIAYFVYDVNKEQEVACCSRYTSRTKNEVRKCKNAALVLFGVPVYFERIWKCYMRYIVQRNPKVHFEAYIHMYSDLHKQTLSSVRNKVSVPDARPQSPDVVRNILNNGSIPFRMTTSRQSTFDEVDLSPWLQYHDTKSFQSGYPFQTLQNMFRQGNSLKKSYETIEENNMIYLPDQKEYSNDIDFYIFARSDTVLLTPIDIPCSGIGENEIWVPSWASHSGINDRFAIAGPNAAKVYASRMEGYKEAILLRRKVDGRQPKDLMWHNSESLLKMWLKMNLLNVTQMDGGWGKVSRVRAHGIVAPEDHAHLIADLVNGTVRRNEKGQHVIDVHIKEVAENIFNNRDSQRQGHGNNQLLEN